MTSDPRGRLRIDLGIQNNGPDAAFEATWDLDAFANLIRSGSILRYIGRFRDVQAVAAHIEAIPRPFAVALCLRLLSRGSCSITDVHGRTQLITWATCMDAARSFRRDRGDVSKLETQVTNLLAELEQLAPGGQSEIPKTGSVLHLRTDLWLGVTTGGAIAHTAGIANAFAQRGMRTILAAFEANPILSATVTQQLLPLPNRFWDIPEMPAIAANATLEGHLEHLIQEVRPSLVYHRLAAMSFIVALQARRRGLPLIIEYNGSEAWIARNWGRAFRNEALALRMEEAVLRAADRIVTVSTALREELIARGVGRSRVRVVMNGVDTHRFRPDIDAAATRKAFGFTPADTVIGFIGSFGVWHGVPLLIEAYAQLLKMAPEFRASTRLLLIGDGAERKASEARIAELELTANATITGIVPQADAPAMLACADILVAPTQPNPDGTAFFGSPTKLFEYMGMGRAIVATRLDQIGEVLADDLTAILVPPRDVTALARGLLRVIREPATRERLGAAARAEAVARHDWGQRLSSILDC